MHCEILNLNFILEFGVFAKKAIPKSSQFGPLEGTMLLEPLAVESNKLALFLENDDGKIEQMDISDESWCINNLYVKLKIYTFLFRRG